jgi:hypothetical protein
VPVLTLSADICPRSSLRQGLSTLRPTLAPTPLTPRATTLPFRMQMKEWEGRLHYVVVCRKAKREVKAFVILSLRHCRETRKLFL